MYVLLKTLIVRIELLLLILITTVCKCICKYNSMTKTHTTSCMELEFHKSYDHTFYCTRKKLKPIVIDNYETLLYVYIQIYKYINKYLYNIIIYV